MPRNKNAGNPKPLLRRRREAAALLNVSIGTLSRLTRAGKIKAIKLGDDPRSAVLYADEELHRFASGH